MTQDIVIDTQKIGKGLNLENMVIKMQQKVTKHKNKGPPFRFSHSSKYTPQNKTPKDPPAFFDNQWLWT